MGCVMRQGLRCGRSGCGARRRSGLRASGPGAWLLLAALALLPGVSHAGPKTRREFQQYDLSVLGFNDGDPYRVKTSEAEGLLEEPDLKVY